MQKGQEVDKCEWERKHNSHYDDLSKLLEENDRASEQEHSTSQRCHGTTENTHTHGGNRVMRTFKAILCWGVNVVSRKMHHIVDGESNDNHHGNGLGHAQLPAIQHHDCHDWHDDEDDCYDCVDRNQHISGRDQQNNKGTDGRNGNSDSDTIEECLLALHPSPKDIRILVDNFEAFGRVLIRKVLNVLVPAFPERQLFGAWSGGDANRLGRDPHELKLARGLIEAQSLRFKVVLTFLGCQEAAKNLLTRVH